MIKNNFVRRSFTRIVAAALFIMAILASGDNASAQSLPTDYIWRKFQHGGVSVTRTGGDKQTAENNAASAARLEMQTWGTEIANSGLQTIDGWIRCLNFYNSGTQFVPPPAQLINGTWACTFTVPAQTTTIIFWTPGNQN